MLGPATRSGGAGAIGKGTWMSGRPINLALQGGGAHGAFAWGVLDRLLEGDELAIAAISGTSAGALNGAAVVAGLAVGPGAAGRQAAHRNWRCGWACAAC